MKIHLSFNSRDMMRSHRLRLIELHIAALLFGLTGLFGKALAVSPAMIVLGRAAFAAVSLGIFLCFTGRMAINRSPGGWLLLIAAGLMLAIHWTSFFHSVQISTVAVGVLTFSTSPVFSTLIEPWIFKEPWKPATLLPVLLVMIGVVCLAPSVHLSDHIVRGACWGTVSGLSFAVYTLLNRLQVRSSSPQLLSFGQNTVVVIAMLLLMRFKLSHIGVHEISLLAMLGILCTAVAQSLYISSLRGVSAQLACVVSTLESPYGIAFAMVFLGEIPQIRTISGGLFILIAAVIATWMQRRQPICASPNASPICDRNADRRC